MIRYIEVDGIKLGESASLPVIPVTEEGRRLGHIPGWAMLSDPDYMEIVPQGTNRTVLDRVSGKMLLASTPTASPAIKVVDSASGEALIHADPLESSYFQFYGESDIDPEQWTVWAVIQGLPESGPRNFLVLSEPGDTGAGISLSISYGGLSGSLVVYEYDENVAYMPQRLVVDAGLLDPSLKLVMVTFSVDHGLRAFVNGVLLGAEPTDRRPLTHGFDANYYRMFRFFRGRYGMAGILNLDLGAPENAEYRRSIEGFLMEKYGI